MLIRHNKTFKALGLVLFLLLALLAAGCGEAGEDTSQERQAANDEYSYTIPAGWVQSDKYSSEDKIFYVQDGHEDEEQPDNISVEVKSSRYAADEHMQFRDAIVAQLTMQLRNVPALLTGDGRFTDEGAVLYVFTITEEPPEGAPEDAVGVVTRQYYVIDDKQYALIHLTNFSGAEEADAAAERLATSFCFIHES